MSNPPSNPEPDREELARRARRRFLAGVGALGAAGAAGGAYGGATLQDALGGFFQDHYQRMTKDEIRSALERIERRAQAKFGKAIHCEDTPPIPNTVFGYALNVSKCKGYRDCVEACIKENNQGRDSQVQYIRVLEMDKG